jgi:hypothetical protein
MGMIRHLPRRHAPDGNKTTVRGRKWAEGRKGTGKVLKILGGDAISKGERPRIPL